MEARGHYFGVWRKGRLAEVREVNGWVVDKLHEHGQGAPVNKSVIQHPTGDIPVAAVSK